MSRDPFSSAGTGSRITDLEGNLLLITPTEHLTGINTIHGERDAIDAEVVVLDAEGGPEEHSGVRIFQGKLIGSLKPCINRQPKLGRLGKQKGEKGKSDAWVLLPPTEADKQIARDYIAGKTADPFAA